MGRNRVVYVVIALVVVLSIIRAPIYFSSQQSEVNKSKEKSTFQHQQNWRMPDPDRPMEPIDIIRRDCGQLCNTSRLGTPGPYFNHISSPVDCEILFKNEYIDRSHELEHAPKRIPDELWNDFTMDGRLKVTDWYFDQRYFEKKARTPVWTKKQVNQWVTLATKGKLDGNYGVSETNALRDGIKHAPGILKGRVLIIGSENPWVEACVIEAGAKEIVTLEYGEIKSEHSKIKTMTPFQFRKQYLDGTLGLFDAVVTFSSVEHSGLGRYGDALNPWGDIIAIARARCVTKPGGSLTIGVMYDYEHDHIRFNAGRWYGKIRYPYLTSNWKQFYRGVGSQRVYVFTNGEIPDSVRIQKYLKEPHPYHKIENINKTFSQVKQDQVVYNTFPKENGFFIEMGGFDGHTLSNTLWLERRHNWTGLLVEANPDLCNSIDKVKRRIWRLCSCISSESNVTFIKGGTLGSSADSVDKDHLKLLNTKLKVTVPCFTLNTVLEQIGVKHINYFSLDVEGAEMVVLNSMKKELASKKIIVDIWTIEYRVWDGKKIIVDSSMKNLENLRTFFKDVGGYVEHSQLSNNGDSSDGMALDVVIVNKNTWCNNNKVLPNGIKC